MTSTLNAEIATVYGCLDTNAVIDGDAGHSHVLRELARSTNRLLEQSSPVVNLVFDASTDQSEAQIGAYEAYLSFYEWRPLLPAPMMLPKKANHRYLDLKIIANITADKTVRIQVGTSARHFDPVGDTDRPGTIEVTGTGAWAVYDVDGVPASNQEIEAVNVWIQGSIEGSTPASGTYGGPTSGSGEFFVDTRSGTFWADSATWNTTAPTLADDQKHVLLVKAYSVETLMLPPMKITAVTAATTEKYLDLVRPPLHTAAFGVLFTNDPADPTMTFEITQISEFRVANIAAYSRLD